MDFLKQLGITPELLLTQIIGFLILMFLLWRFAFGKIFSILDERRDTIQASYDQLDADRAAMEQTRRDYEARLAGIEAEAREKIQAAVQEAQALRGNLIADAQTQVGTILAQGRNESERERQKAFLEMRQQIVALAIGAAGKVVGESLNDARQNKLVDDFITGVGTGSVRSIGGVGSADAVKGAASN
jgi:F-type H+-transporting ATPase subunit b